MRKFYVLSLLFIFSWAAATAQITQTFSYTGANQTFVVPAGVTSISLKSWAGGGGGSSLDGSGGSSALVKGTFAVTPGQTLVIIVGGGGKYNVVAGGFGGGGAAGAAGTGASGGGYSGVFLTSVSQANAISIVGGGGGGGYYSAAKTYGGAGGATSGTSGGDRTAGTFQGGRGATVALAGAGGAGTTAGSSGSALTGGAGGVNTYGGGGGGGGYYGGGGGYGSAATNYSAGGGGGSSFLGTMTATTNTAGVTNTTGATTQAPGNAETGYVTGVGNGGAAGVNGGNGLIILTYTLPACTTPTDPALLTLTPISSSQIDGVITPSGSPTGYIVVRYPTGSAVTSPVAGTTYAAGNAIGLGTVAYVGTSLNFSATGLVSTTTYDFYVYAYNNTACAGPVYSTGSATGTATTPGCISYSGTIPIGPTGTFANLTTAISTLVSCGYTGNIILQLQTTYTSGGETFPIVFPNTLLSSATKTITVQPAPTATLTISGASSAGPIIKIYNANYITIDGSNNSTTTRDLTITNTSVTTPNVIVIGSTGATPVTNVIVKNTILINGINTSSALVVSDGATIGSAGYFNNITLDNNAVQKAYNGIFVVGNTASGNGSGLLITNNSMATSGANSIRLAGISVTGVDGSSTISNNTVSNITDANNEYVRGIYIGAGTNNLTVSANTISGLTSTSTGAAAAVGGIYLAPGATAASINITGNTISGLASAGSTFAGFAGIASFSPTANISGNTITGLTQNGSIDFWGIVISGATTGVVSGNTITALTTALSGTASAVNIQGATSGLSIFNNKINNIKNTYTIGYGANGVSLASTSNTANIKVYNNFISNVTGYGYTTANITDNGYGIIISSGAGYAVDYNSISMNTNQTSTTALSACINITAGVTVAGAITLIDNIFSNTETNNLAANYAIYSSAAATVFGTINYNDYYSAGTNLGYIGSARNNIAAIQAGFGQNANSVSILPVFTSATDLHLPGAANILLNDLGTPLPAVTTVDIDGDTRPASGSTYPDMGADEFTIPANDAGIIGLSGSYCAGTQHIFVTIRNFGSLPLLTAVVNSTINGVPQAPILFTGPLASGASATVDLGAYTFVSGVPVPIIAYTTLPNALPDGNTLNDSFTGTINTGLSGTYTVGAGGVYTTLTSAVNYANTYGLCGPTVFSLISSSYSTGETFPIVINSLTGSSATNTLTIKPATGIAPTISGTVAGGALIKLYGADNIIIDGSNVLSGTSRDLSVTNTDPTAAGAASVIWLSSVASPLDGATNNTIKNSNIFCYDNVDNLGDIISNGAAYNAAADAPNSNNTITNNSFTKSQNGIYIFGNATNSDDGWVITNNSFGSTVTASKLTFSGIVMANTKNWLIDKNIIAGVNVSAASTVSGIDIEGNQLNGVISNNKISDIKNPYVIGYGSAGIELDALTTSSNITVKNNFVSDVASYGYVATFPTSGDNGNGIVLDYGGGYNVYFNTVVLNTNQGGTGALRDAALLVSSNITAVGSLDVRNNIFGNSQTTPANVNSRYAVLSEAANNVYSNFNYNDLYATSGVLFGKGDNTTQSTTIAAVQTNSGANANSINVVPTYVSASDFHLQTDNNCALDGAGTAITGITTDIDADTRNTPPDIGADEFNSTFALLITNPASVCSGGTVNLTLAGITSGSTAGTTLGYYTNAGATVALGTPAAVVVTGPATYYIKSVKGSCTLIQPVNVTVTPSPAITGITPATQTLCASGTAGAITVSATGSGLTYQFYSNTVNSNVGGTSVGATNGGQTASYTPSLFTGTTYYYVVVSGTCTPPVTSSAVSVTVASSGTWYGLDNNWFNAANWCGGVPTNTTNVVIPGGLANYPIVTTGTALANYVNIALGGSITVNNNGIFSLHGTVTNSGTFDLTDGTLSLDSIFATIGGSQVAGGSVKNLTVSATTGIIAGATNMLSITGNMSFLTSGNTFNTNGNITLVSNAATTASVTDLTNNGALTGNSIIGNASVQRYISAQRKWRFLAVNTKVGTGSKNTVQDNWMEGQTPGTHTSPSGLGMWVTDLAGTGANFDSASYTPNIKWWNGSMYNGITDPTAFNLRSYPAYMTFVRGDRNATGSNALTNSTVLRQFGGLTQGTTGAITIGAGAVYTAVGNPYASAVNIKKITYSTGNIINAAVWDPNLTGGLGLGAFQYITSPGPGQDFIIIPGGGSYGSFGSVMDTIESGQGYFMQGTATSRDINFVEVAKASKGHDVFFAPGAEQRVGAVLYAVSPAGTTILDGFLVRFAAGYNTGVDADDAAKFSNTGESISDKRAGHLLAIEYRSLPDEYDTVFINMSAMQLRNYQWTFDLTNMDAPGRAAFLVDQMTGTQTPLSLTGGNTYNFSVTNVAASYAANRFYIVFRPAGAAGPLPVTFTTISAARQADKTILVNWKSENEINIGRYEVERSAKGTLFSSVNLNTQATNNSGGSAAYGRTDVSASSGENYYRIKAVSNNGQVQYSAIVKVGPLSAEAAITIYPNPVKDRMMNVRFENEPAGKYSLQLTNKAGQTVYSGTETISGDEVKTIHLSKIVAAGSYTLLVRDEHDKKETIQVIIE